MYEYNATLLRVVDGDTIWVDLDLGCDIHTHLSLRLYGINTPEMNTEEGKVAKSFVLDWVVPDLIIKTLKDKREKYGRYLATVFRPSDEVSLNQALLDAGHAVEYYP